MGTLVWILGATLLTSVISFVGALTLSFKGRHLKNSLVYLVALSAGTLMGGALLHLLPEAIEASEGISVFIYVLLGFSLFFLVERVLHWHHCHHGKCDVHTFTYMTLFGDAIHNFIDGLVIASSFIVAIPLGISTTIAIIFHEIPQELSDFGVLLHGGFSKTKALLYNFLSALTAVLGAVIGFTLASVSESIQLFMLPFAAGSFIYIAASDLVPELHKEENMKKSLISFVFFVMGIVLMYGLKIVFEG